MKYFIFSVLLHFTTCGFCQNCLALVSDTSELFVHISEPVCGVDLKGVFLAPLNENNQIEFFYVRMEKGTPPNLFEFCISLENEYKLFHYREDGTISKRSGKLEKNNFEDKINMLGVWSILCSSKTLMNNFGVEVLVLKKKSGIFAVNSVSLNLILTLSNHKDFFEQSLLLYSFIGDLIK